MPSPPSNTGAAGSRHSGGGAMGSGVMVCGMQALSGEGFTCAVELPSRLSSDQAGAGQVLWPDAEGPPTLRAATCTNPSLAQDLLQQQPAFEAANEGGYAPGWVASTPSCVTNVVCLHKPEGHGSPPGQLSSSCTLVCRGRVTLQCWQDYRGFIPCAGSRTWPGMSLSTSR